LNASQPSLLALTPRIIRRGLSVVAEIAASAGADRYLGEEVWEISHSLMLVTHVQCEGYVKIMMIDST
jgi:hypothetical protein